MATRGWYAGFGAAILLSAPAAAQEPVAWGGEELIFHTFSIAAIDPATHRRGSPKRSTSGDQSTFSVHA